MSGEISKQSHDVFKLWDGQEKPYYKENNLQEYEEDWETIRCVFNITEPTLTVYPAKGENTKKAVLIIPGGNYEMVAIHHEGYDMAKELSNHGITAAVLKYRLPNPETSDRPDLVPLSDARRALGLLRENANKYGFHPDEVGVMGFSAGSHLATIVSLWKSAHKEENPNYSVLIYGVTNFDDDNIAWLESNLYFRKLTEAEIIQNQLFDLITKDTPPTFLAHAYDDDVCKVEETTLYAQKLFEHKVPVEVHLFPKGGHGFGLGLKQGGTDQWVELFVNWLKYSVS